MQEYEDIIDSMYEIFKVSENIEDNLEKNKFIYGKQENFRNFRYEITTILRQYQYKTQGDIKQNQVSDKLRYVIRNILKENELFEKVDDFKYYKANILDSLDYNENKLAFSIQYENDMTKLESALEYLEERSQLKNILKQNDLFEDDFINKQAVKKYTSNIYEQNVFGHGLIQFKNNFMKLPKEKVVELLGYIDNYDFFDEEKNNLNFYEKNFLDQYANSILKLKSIFIPNKVKDDKIFNAVLEGKIKNSKIIKDVFSNISLDNICDMLPDDLDEVNFFDKLTEKLNKSNFSTDDINNVMYYVIDKYGFASDLVANLLLNIDVPNDYDEFINGNYVDRYPWLQNIKIFEKLKDSEKSIEDAASPILPAKYYIAKINKLDKSSINEYFITNLLTLLGSDYYSDIEKENIKECLKNNNVYNEYIVNEKIDFNDIENVELNVKRAYCSGQVIPIDLAKKLLNDDLSNGIKIDKTMLQACMQSIVCNTLKEKNIDIGNRVFFGKSNSSGGYHSGGDSCIWFNENYLNNYIESDKIEVRTDIFRVAFHEMQHAIQKKNIDENKIDYLTYNFMKEEVIRRYDEEYYSNNYKSFFKEADSRKEEALGALNFINELNPNIYIQVEKHYTDKYINERIEYPVHKSFNKKISFGDKNVIDVTEYVKNLIENNPEILEKYPMLEIEYNRDGSRKDTQTLLQEYENGKYSCDENKKGLYSIYYGVISKKIQENELVDECVNEKIDKFKSEETELVTLEDMDSYYKSVDKSNLRRAYSRIINIKIENRKKLSIEGSEKEIDNNPR